jgi:ADP-ribose pyrophosphatase
MTKHNEKEEVLLKSIIFEIVKATIKQPNNKLNNFDIVVSAPSTRVFLFDDENVILIEQFRPKVGKKGNWGRNEIELPGGKIENGEEIISNAKKEILEEAGVIVHKITPLLDHPLIKDSGLGPGIVYYLKGKVDEIKAPKPEKTEFVKVKKIKLAEAINMIDTGEINDLMSAFAIIYYDNLLRRKRDKK